MKFSERIRRAWRELTVPEELLKAGGAGAPFRGAQIDRLTADWLASLLSPDEEIKPTLRRLRARSRELARNNPYAKHYLSMLAVNVVGPSGIHVQATVRDNDGDLNERINATLESAWARWSESPMIDGTLSRVRLEQLLLKSVATDGEILVRRWRDDSLNEFGFALETIDADLLDDSYNVAPGQNRNEVRMGVEVDSSGKRVAYHVWNAPPGAIAGTLPRRRERIPAADIIHLYDPMRVNQTRGVPWFHAVMSALNMLDKYEEAELVAARIGAAKMGFFSRREGPAGSSGVDVKTDEEGNVQMEANPGTFDFLPEGYQLDTFDPDHPNSAYAQFVKAALRRVATGLSCSYNALASDLEGVNYSSMRSGLLIEREVWRSLQQWWIHAWCRVIYLDWLNTSLLNETLTFDTRNWQRFASAEWTPRGWPWVDPEKDTKAGIAGIQTGLTSRTRLLAEQGLDPETIMRELQQEAKLAKQLGVNVDGPKPPEATKAEKDAEADEEPEDEETDRDLIPVQVNGHGKGGKRGKAVSRW